MAILVVDKIEDGKVPFLRGILTRSLLSAGLPFDEAYKLADKVKSEVSDRKGDKGEITTEEIESIVVSHLRKRKDQAVADQYLHRGEKSIPINVFDRDGQPQPFSKGHLSQALEICAFSQEKSYAITSAIEHSLVSSGRKDISSTELARLTYKYLLDHESPDIAKRYVTWVEFSRDGSPLVLLVGGTTGSGKSTISSEIAHRLNIVRTQSTDMLREVMRMMMPKRLVPTLHTSSYTAWTVLPSSQEDPVSFDTHMESGYLTQARQVAVGIEAVLQRAEREHVSMILEGVHINPELQRQFVEDSDAVIVPFILAVVKRKKLRKHLKGRGQQVASRRSENYLKYFESIWRLQSFLLSEADRHSIPIIPNVDEDETIQEVMSTISAVLETRYDGDPKKAFKD
ncbi:MAG: ATP cone domain-containing protein [Rhodothermales bacterium]